MYNREIKTLNNCGESNHQLLSMGSDAVVESSVISKLNIPKAVELRPLAINDIIIYC